MPLWTDAYLGDTTHLTTLEHGAYLLLLITAWRARDNRLPDDDRLLARYAKLTPAQWQRVKPILSAFFRIEDGYWTQGRLTDEANAVKQYRARQSAAGSASALKRKGRHATTVKSGCNQTPTPISISNTNDLSPNGDCASDDALKPEHVSEKWNELAERIGKPKVRSLTPERRQLLKARIAQYDIDDFVAVLSAIEASPFLRGDRNWRGATFDWVFKKANFQKILEGNYND
jgi:uncharacterized protein YdaU (DUF1376 family)